MLTFFGVERDRDEAPVDVFPTGKAPFIRKAEEGLGNRLVDDGAFGLLPHFARELAYGRRTYNARSETVRSLPSFRDAWRRGQRCIVPAEAIFEPNYESGKAVRWRISQHGDVPMGIAGIYTRWRHPDGRDLYSFAMLTVNADDHELMRRFHAPGDEKRMVVILDEAEYDAWLDCPPEQMMSFMKQYPVERLEAEPFPKEPTPARPKTPPRLKGQAGLDF